MRNQYPSFENERIASPWGMQTSVSEAAAFISKVDQPLAMVISQRGQSLSKVAKGRMSWVSVKRQAEVWFRLLSPSDYLRGQLERTICRTFFLTDHMNPMWRPEISKNPYQQSLISLLDSWTPEARDPSVLWYFRGVASKSLDSNL
ncbi:MAG: hypothetical protein KVP17_002605 [Porospora cf. gigantea B]|uniref:uncharacterized protein n=1 Tax=Porospora cf. gigantea B TaxID=2853592 RepID=UPI003571B2B2|nr:MAG: hypothetical protein KVP17_002605 [Porospora cf. gigantea B]